MRQRGEKRPHVSIASNVPSANMFLEENLQIQACSRLYFEASAQLFKLEHGTFKSYSIVFFCDAVRIIPTSIFATHPTDDVRKLIKKNKKKTTDVARSSVSAEILYMVTTTKVIWWTKL